MVVGRITTGNPISPRLMKYEWLAIESMPPHNK